MSSPHDVAVSEIESPELPQRRSRWWLWLLLVAALPLAGGALLTGLRLWVERQEDRGIVSATLPDGSQIIVEQVSVGRVHTHVLRKGTRIPLPILRTFGFDPAKSSLTTNADRILIFFRHVDPLGKPRNLKWWRAHEATTDDGEELWDDEASILYLQEQAVPPSWSISSVHGTLGFDTPPPNITRVVGAVELPVSAFSGPTIPLRLLNEKGEAMASLNIPVSLPPLQQTWVAANLPIRKTFGSVDVTLKSVTSEARPLQVRDQTRAYYTLDRQWELTENGQPAKLWRIDNESVKDESGDYGLPPKGAWKSPVWRLSANLVPILPDPPPELTALPAAFQGAKEFAGVAVPTRDTMAEVSQTVVLTIPGSDQAFPLNIDRVGAGTTTWSGTGPRPQSHGRGMVASDPIGDFSVNSSNSSSDWSLRVRAKGAWLRLTHNALSKSERLEYAVFDDQRHLLKSAKHFGGEDVTWLHVQPLPDSKQMILRAYPMQVFPMEFDFAPPLRPRLEEAERDPPNAGPNGRGVQP